MRVDRRWHGTFQVQLLSRQAVGIAADGACVRGQDPLVDVPTREETQAVGRSRAKCRLF